MRFYSICSVITIRYTHNADDIPLLVNTPTQAESQLHCLEQAAGALAFK